MGENGKQSREEGAVDGSTDLTDRPPRSPPLPPTRDAYTSRPALVSSFLTNRGDTALSEEGQQEAKQHLKAVPGAGEARGYGCILGFCLKGERLPHL